MATALFPPPKLSKVARENACPAAQPDMALAIALLASPMRYLFAPGVAEGEVFRTAMVGMACFDKDSNRRLDYGEFARMVLAYVEAGGEFPPSVYNRLVT
eukprot:scaffold2480_cov385-Prasinococcus_capsulatus_cf.AAC.12